MKELVEGLEKSERVDWLLDTCFLIHEFSAGRVKELSEFCTRENVGMSSFNLLELEHVMHRLPGPISHHVRDFLKQRLVKNVEVGVEPGDREGEKRYVSDFDPHVLEVVSDPSDAVMFVLALRLRANVLTRDRHHVFTAAADNYSDHYGVKVLNKIE